MRNSLVILFLFAASAAAHPILEALIASFAKAANAIGSALRRGRRRLHSQRGWRYMRSDRRYCSLEFRRRLLYLLMPQKSPQCIQTRGLAKAAVEKVKVSKQQEKAKQQEGALGVPLTGQTALPTVPMVSSSSQKRKAGAMHEVSTSAARTTSGNLRLSELEMRKSMRRHCSRVFIR
ncbi:hypothetical protein C8J56DRAFT_889085 [Mycena floridula]|nr:hypothetical protein C8J56DRAFT_889085 [Mycena floridula]